MLWGAILHAAFSWWEEEEYEASVFAPGANLVVVVVGAFGKCLIFSGERASGSLMYADGRIIKGIHRKEPAVKWTDLHLRGAPRKSAHCKGGDDVNFCMFCSRLKVLASRMAELPWTVDRFFPSASSVFAETPFCHIEPVERTDALPYANVKKKSQS